MHEPDTAVDAMEDKKREIVLQTMRVSAALRDVFVLGCLDRRITLYSQQLRALNLAAALFADKMLKPHEPVVVVGAGAGGLTCAAALHHLGAEVTLIEREHEVLSILSKKPDRWIHPNVYDWPQEGWNEAEAKLEILNWRSAKVESVHQQLLRGWNKSFAAEIKPHFGVTDVKVSKTTENGRRTVTWNPRGRVHAAVVVLAVGFGLEDTRGGDNPRYWEQDDIPARLFDKQNWLLSGCGDGALTELLRLRLKDFRHETMLADYVYNPRFKGYSPKIEDIEEQIRAIEKDPDIQRSPRELHDAYARIKVPWLIDAMELRENVTVTLNAQTENFLSAKASALNRFLVSQLYQKPGGFNFLSGRLEVDNIGGTRGNYTITIDGETHPFNRVLTRHGPRPRALEKIRSIWRELKVARDARLEMPDVIDQTRARYWSDGLYGSVEPSWRYFTSFARGDIFDGSSPSPAGQGVLDFLDLVERKAKALADCGQHLDDGPVASSRHWRDHVAPKAGEARVLLSVLSRDALHSVDCSREWSIFESRLLMAQDGKIVLDASPIIPLFLDPKDDLELPGFVQRLPRAHSIDSTYLKLGLRRYLEQEPADVIDQLAASFARLIVELGSAPPLPVLNDILSLDRVPEAFKGEDVANFVAARADPEGQTELKWWARIDRGGLAKQEPPSKRQLLRFFDGSRPNWAIAQSEHVPLLPTGEKLLAELADRPYGVSLDLFLGPTGEGKTTLLMQLACQLAHLPGVQVFYLRERAPHFDSAALNERLREATRTVLIVDQAAVQHAGMHEFLLRRQHEFTESNRRGLHIIAAARPYQWERVEAHTYAWRSRTDRTQVWRSIGFNRDAAEAIISGWHAADDDPAVALRRLYAVPPADRVEHLQVAIESARAGPVELIRRSGTQHESRISLFGGLLGVRFHSADLEAHLRDLLYEFRTGFEHGAVIEEAWKLTALVDALTTDEQGRGNLGEGIDERVLMKLLNFDPVSKRARGLSKTDREAILEVLEDAGAIVPVVGKSGRNLQTRHIDIARTGLQLWLTDSKLRQIKRQLKRVVDSTVEVGYVPGYAAILHCALQVEPRLSPLRRIPLETVYELAIAAGRASWQAEPRIDHFTEYLGALIRSGKLNRNDWEVGAELIRQHWGGLVHMDRDGDKLRFLVQKWAHLEQLLGRPRFALWLHLLGLSDQLRRTGGGEPVAMEAIDLKRGLVYTIRTAKLVRFSDPIKGIADLLGLDSEIPRAEQPMQTWEPTKAPPSFEAVKDALTRLQRRISIASDLAEVVRPLAADGLTFFTLERAYRKEVLPRFGKLVTLVPKSPDADDIALALMEYFEELGIDLYEAQEEAINLITHGDCNVLLNTPTGSGKSLVALAAHFTALSHGHRSIYTAPTKALVNEKFFDLCKAFGARNVGLIHGDTTANRNAMIICCTAEILANMALSEGRASPFKWVIMDEFHYYGDRDRGMAWLLPLVSLDEARFLLMSATIGWPKDRAQTLARQTGRPTELIRSTTRPVPLEFDYRDQLLPEALSDLRSEGQLPVYLVTFSKHEATTLAQEIAPLKVTKASPEVRAAVEEERLDTPFGVLLGKLLRKGIGVHHSGMLPRYRRFVERLAGLPDGQGLQVICGTDTLGVGVNMPIRSVLFTKLYKFDGERVRILSIRDFQQVAGRAGRRNKSKAAPEREEKGTVWVLAPQHEVQNRLNRAKGKKKHTIKPPPNFKGWNRETMKRLATGQPQKLGTQFKVSGPMVSTALSRRDEDGAAALRGMIGRIGLATDKRESVLVEVEQIIGELVEKRLVQRRSELDAEAVGFDVDHTQDHFERPLSRFLKDALDGLDADGGDPQTQWSRAVSVIESTLTAGWKERDGQLLRDPEPSAIIRAQQHAKRRRLIEKKRQAERDPSTQDGVIYKLQKQIDTVLWPEPEKRYLDDRWLLWSRDHPFTTDESGPAPRYIALEMYEEQYSFNDYIRHHNQSAKGDDVLINEGRLLYYLSELYKVLRKEKPPPNIRDAKFEEFRSWLEALVYQVDGTMVYEWERFEDSADTAVNVAPDEDTPRRDPTRDPRAFERQVRNEVFSWVRALARGDYASLARRSTMSQHEIKIRFERFLEEHEELLFGPDARNIAYFRFQRPYSVKQTLLGIDGVTSWELVGRVDVERSSAESDVVITLLEIRDGVSFYG